MQGLILVRHAEAEQAGSSDFERRLTDFGEREAALMARRLSAHGACPTLIVTSPAARARATAAIFAADCELAPARVVAAPELYLAGTGALRTVIDREAGDAETLMVVAHNPGLSELVVELSGTALGELPTAGVVQLEWRGRQGDAPARLLRFDHPRSL